MINWLSTRIYQPPRGSVVLTARRSGYLVCEWRYETAVFDDEYRPFTPWLDITGEALEPVPEYWSPTPINPPEETC